DTGLPEEPMPQSRFGPAKPGARAILDSSLRAPSRRTPSATTTHIGNRFQPTKGEKLCLRQPAQLRYFTGSQTRSPIGGRRRSSTNSTRKQWLSSNPCWFRSPPRQTEEKPSGDG